MSVHYHVYGIKERDKQWDKMKAVLDACYAADLSIPDEVAAYFGDSDPEGDGFETPLDGANCVEKHKADMQDGFIVDVTKLPAGIKKIKFVVSY